MTIEQNGADWLPVSIELTSRSGHPRHLCQWDGSPFRIGRAYDNDLVLDDPWVCSHHIELRLENGVPQLRDLGSLNGTYKGNSKNRLDHCGLVDGMVVQLGHSELRFHSGSSVLAPTLRDATRFGMYPVLHNPLILFVMTIMALLCLAASELLQDPGKMGLLEIAEEMTYPLIGVLVWSGFWAMLNRLLAHKACFVAHLTIALAGVAALFITSQVISAIAFALDLNQAHWWIKWLGRVLILATVVFVHLRFSTQMSRSRVFIIASGIALLLFGTPAVGSFIEKTSFSSLPWLDPLLRPPGFQLRDGVSPEDFMSRAGSLRVRVDESASE